MRELERFDWPGNVRQLRNCLEWVSVMTPGDVLTVEDLPHKITHRGRR
jgi:two-component system nitrogen regulation response regulator GlnG